MKLLLYCTKSKPYLIDLRLLKCEFELWDCESPANLNGKIVAECDYEVEEIHKTDFHNINYYDTDTLIGGVLTKKSCLGFQELDDYLKGKNGYAIHIKNLNIFDEPKYTRDYFAKDKDGDIGTIMKAPQNMMYAYDLGNDRDCILISIRPEWLCKILNGEKTIEIRKKVLKEMK